MTPDPALAVSVVLGERTRLHFAKAHNTFGKQINLTELEIGTTSHLRYVDKRCHAPAYMEKLIFAPRSSIKIGKQNL